MAEAAGQALYDRVELTGEDGQQRRLTKAQFEALPLGERVRAILADRARFFLGGTEVPPKVALARNF